MKCVLLPTPSVSCVSELLAAQWLLLITCHFSQSVTQKIILAILLLFFSIMHINDAGQQILYISVARLTG